MNLFALALCCNKASAFACIIGSPCALQMSVCRACQDVVILPDGLRRHVLWLENVGKVVKRCEEVFGLVCKTLLVMDARLRQVMLVTRGPMPCLKGCKNLNTIHQLV